MSGDSYAEVKKKKKFGNKKIEKLPEKKRDSKRRGGGSVVPTGGAAPINLHIIRTIHHLSYRAELRFPSIRGKMNLVMKGEKEGNSWKKRDPSKFFYLGLEATI